eukprot:scaffold10910_cov95-Isochrysis_galbana.AAC.3
MRRRTHLVFSSSTSSSPLTTRACRRWSTCRPPVAGWCASTRTSTRTAKSACRCSALGTVRAGRRRRRAARGRPSCRCSSLSRASSWCPSPTSTSRATRRRRAPPRASSARASTMGTCGCTRCGTPCGTCCASRPPASRRPSRPTSGTCAPCCFGRPRAGSRRQAPACARRWSASSLRSRLCSKLWGSRAAAAEQRRPEMPPPRAGGRVHKDGGAACAGRQGLL